MNPFPRFTPVIHVKDSDQAVTQTHCALENGAGGVFLIHHRGNHKQLLDAYRAVRHNLCSRRSPGAVWVGLNFLDLDAKDALEACRFRNVDALWVDNADTLKDYDMATRDDMLPPVFASALFKYQAPPADPKAYTRDIEQRFDMVVTSGDGTGEAADVDKIERMHSWLTRPFEPVPLALASGVSLENIRGYLPYIRTFMVATHISLDAYTLDPVKVRAMADIIDEYDRNKSR